MVTVVEAALHSTQVYLDFLTKQQRGVDLHTVRRIKGEEFREQLVNGILLYTYHYRTQRGLTLQPETRLTYLPREAPSVRIPVLVIYYERSSGTLALGFPQLQDSASGKVEIDYKWLVARLRNWLEDNGSRVQSPFAKFLQKLVIDPTVVDRWLEETAPLLPRLSDDQRHAVRCALSHPCTYTWGPPGTGKTFHVLACTAGFLIAQQKRILLIAPTNQAVDNAMRALLALAPKLHIDPKHFIRLGIPTLDFLQEHPGICEDRTARVELAVLNAKLATLRNDLDAARAVGALIQRHHRAREKVVILQASVADQEQQLLSCRARMSDLHTKIALVEETHSQLSRTVIHLERDLGEVGFFASLFTSKKSDIMGSLSEARARLLAVHKRIDILHIQLAKEDLTHETIQSRLRQTGEILQTAQTDEQRLEEDLQLLRGGSQP